MCIRDRLQLYIDYLKNPKRFTAQGVKPPKGILLYGPPGTGKTMLAKAMAGESDVTFIPCVATGFVTKYQGSGPESIRTLFKRARRYAPAVIFIDEIDAIGRKRGQVNSGHGEEMALNALPIPTKYGQECLMAPEEIAEAMVFLASDSARGVNGNIMFVDGGTDALLNSEKVY